MDRLTLVLVSFLVASACSSDAPSSPTPLDRELSGTILDTEDQPVSGATIRAFVNGEPELRQTDARGAFTFQFGGLDRDFRVRVNKQGYLSRDLVVSSSRVATIQMQPQRNLGIAESLTETLRASNPLHVVSAAQSSFACGPCWSVNLGLGPVRQGTVQLRAESVSPTSNPLSLWVTGTDDLYDTYVVFGLTSPLFYETTIVSSVTSSTTADGRRVAEVTLPADLYEGTAFVGYRADEVPQTDLAFTLSLSSVN